MSFIGFFARSEKNYKNIETPIKKFIQGYDQKANRRVKIIKGMNVMTKSSCIYDRIKNQH